MAEYIERASVMLHIAEQLHQWGDDYDVEQVLGDVEDFPAADVVEVRHGEWILSNINPYGDPNIFNRTQKICSCCGWMNACRYAYCPNCGAKMDGKGEGE